MCYIWSEIHLDLGIPTESLNNDEAYLSFVTQRLWQVAIMWIIYLAKCVVEVRSKVTISGEDVAGSNQYYT